MFALLAACRFAHYTAAFWLFGTSIYVWMLAPPPLRTRLAPAACRQVRAASLVLLATYAGWLLLQAASMADGWIEALRPDTLAAVLTQTDFGRAWLLHGLFCIGTAAAMAAALPSLACAGSGLVLASLGFIGHAVMRGGPLGWASRADLGAHLLAAGFWVGCLWPLVATMRGSEDVAVRPSALAALRRFSTVGHAAVFAVVLTGTVNSLLIFSSADARFGVPYLLMLSVKVCVVAAMIGLAVLNRYRLVPRLRTRPDALRHLIRNSFAEIWLGLSAIALVSVLGLIDPHG